MVKDISNSLHSQAHMLLEYPTKSELSSRSDCPSEDD